MGAVFFHVKKTAHFENERRCSGCVTKNSKKKTVHSVCGKPEKLRWGMHERKYWLGKNGCCVNLNNVFTMTKKKRLQFHGFGGEKNGGERYV